MKTFVICEAGSNHGGSLDHAKRLIDLAVNVGAQAVKFQYLSDYQKFMERRHLSETPYPFSIARAWLPYLTGYCGDRIEFMSSTFLPEDIETVAPYVRRFKISAYENEDKEFLEAHLKYGKEMLASNSLNGKAKALWCVSQYPCPDNRLHLFYLDEGFAGLSDHTKNPLTGALAVARGARYIETHFRLNDTSPSCPDYEVARSPEELSLYIRNIREAEVLMG